MTLPWNSLSTSPSGLGFLSCFCVTCHLFCRSRTSSFLGFGCDSTPAASLIRCTSALLQLAMGSSASQRWTSRMDNIFKWDGVAGCSARSEAVGCSALSELLRRGSSRLFSSARAAWRNRGHEAMHGTVREFARLKTWALQWDQRRIITLPESWITLA